MSNLVYKYINNVGCVPQSDWCLFTCKDNKIHIRLKEYGKKPEAIIGFEQKLTFVVTWLVSDFASGYIVKNYLDNVTDTKRYREIFDDVLTHFYASDVYRSLYRQLKTLDWYSGMYILPAYSRKLTNRTVFDMFGQLANLDALSKNVDLNKLIGDDLMLFLLNDAIEINISEYKSNIDYSKFIKKHNKKKKIEQLNIFECEEGDYNE